MHKKLTIREKVHRLLIARDRYCIMDHMIGAGMVMISVYVWIIYLAHVNRPIITWPFRVEPNHVSLKVITIGAGMAAFYTLIIAHNLTRRYILSRIFHDQKNKKQKA
jgi:hypothetical protein